MACIEKKELRRWRAQGGGKRNYCLWFCSLRDFVIVVRIIGVVQALKILKGLGPENSFPQNSGSFGLIWRSETTLVISFRPKGLMVTCMHRGLLHLCCSSVFLRGPMPSSSIKTHDGMSRSRDILVGWVNRWLERCSRDTWASQRLQSSQLSESVPSPDRF